MGGWGARLLMATLAAVGVEYGDIGRSPLYKYRCGVCLCVCGWPSCMCACMCAHACV